MPARQAKNASGTVHLLLKTATEEISDHVEGEEGEEEEDVDGWCGGGGHGVEVWGEGVSPVLKGDAQQSLTGDIHAFSHPSLVKWGTLIERNAPRRTLAASVCE